MITNSRENAFDFLRLFAALSVVVGHSVEHFETNFLWHQLGGAYWFNDGVAVFFILSGLLVYKSCENAFEKNRPIMQYYVNRLLRIAPAIYVYLIVTIISFFIFGVLTIDEIDNGFFAWVASTIFLFPVYHPSIFSDFGIGVVNGSLWTIPVEFGFYVVLPIFVVFRRKFNFMKMLLLFFLMSIGSLVFYNYLTATSAEPPLWVKFFGVSFLPHLIFFVVGILLGKTWEKISHSKILAFGSLTLYIIIKHEILFKFESVYLVWELLWAMPLGYFVVWFGYNAPSFLYRLTQKLGDISYGIYIWHMVVVNYFIFLSINEKLDGTLLISLSLIITIALGLASWWLVEKQALKFKPYNSKTGEERKVNSEDTAGNLKEEPTRV